MVRLQALLSLRESEQQIEELEENLMRLLQLIEASAPFLLPGSPEDDMGESHWWGRMTMPRAHSVFHCPNFFIPLLSRLLGVTIDINGRVSALLYFFNHGRPLSGTGREQTGHGCSCRWRNQFLRVWTPISAFST